MKINCDLAESFGSWKMGQDDLVMPHIDMANIACGYHASDPSVIYKTLLLAKKHDVEIGAHPSYPDLVGFGRRSMVIEEAELIPLLQYQISAVKGMAEIQGLSLNYVKPHGALYNDMMKDLKVFDSICQAVSQISTSLDLVVQALPNIQDHQNIASKYQLSLRFEAFADRNYQDNGLLMPRSQANAVLECIDDIVERCRLLKQTGQLTSANQQPLAMQIDTLCIHGDHPKAAQIAEALRKIFAHE